MGFHSNNISYFLSWGFALLIISMSLVPSLANNNASQSSVFTPQNNAAYIQRFKKIAVVEMHRSGIPASIKLAQAILESAAGKSQLAEKANNHFGIKCGSDWKGRTYKKKDDDYKMGVRVKSCFRAYDNPESSFIDHTKFLTNPSKKSRYGFLFDLKKTDYKGWAKGLKKAGYATNPKYPQLLIKVIEDNQLHQYDFLSLDDVAAPSDAIADVDNKPSKPSISDNNNGDNDELAPVTPNKKNKKDNDAITNPKKNTTINAVDEVVFENDVKAIVIKPNDTPAKIAKRHDLKLSRVLKYNDLNSNAGNMALAEGSFFYLQSKRNSRRGNKNFHVVRGNETMYEISQLYGVKLSKLYSRNKMEVGQEPAQGERIILKSKRNGPPKLRTKKASANAKNNSPNKPKPSDEKSSSKDIVHTVQKGETLYRIAKKYKVSVDDILTWNNMKNNQLEVGQELIIQKQIE